MQTSFTLAQLADPDVAEADKILRACVHCGFCTATCPTYVLLGDELDCPRGRIYLIKDMLENDRPATGEVVKHIDRCLSCLACMTTCPSGVHYMHLVDHARAHIEETYSRPLGDRVLRALLATVLPDRRLFRLSLASAGSAGRGWRRCLGALGSQPARRDAAPRAVPPAAAGREDGQRVFPAQGPRRGRVALLQGCANPVLAPSINEAAIRLLDRTGHRGRAARPARGAAARWCTTWGASNRRSAQARANIDAWTREIETDGLDAIIVTASGCGTTIKDYGFMLRNDPAYAEKAARVSALAKDISEYLAALDLGAAARPRGLKVAYQSACSLQHGQKIVKQPKELLAMAGFTVSDIARGASVLRLGWNLQHHAARDRHAAARPQGGEHRTRPAPT